MDYMDLSIKDREKVKECIRPEFLFFVKPLNVLPYIPRHNENVLTTADKSRVVAITHARGDHDGAYQLLEDLVRYKGWLKCLLDVLRDPEVKLSHAADKMEKCISDANLGHILWLPLDRNALMNDAQPTGRRVVSDGHPASASWTCAEADNKASMEQGLDLLIIGKTGSGKSATGSSILRRKVFRTYSSSHSVTANAQIEFGEFNGRKLAVVDTPGVGDTRMTSAESVQLVIDAMDNAIALYPWGYHAFLLVIAFGGRFTREDLETINLLKQIFGADIVRDFCILVMTRGDMFDLEMEEIGRGKPAFEQWCAKQTGNLGELMKECNHRILLFDNRTKDSKKLDNQVNSLFKMMDALVINDHRYKPADYKKAKETRRRCLVQAKKPVIVEEAINEMRLICQELEQTRNQPNTEVKLGTLKEMLNRLKKLRRKVRHEDNGTSTLDSLESSLESMETAVSDSLMSCHLA